MNSQTIIKVAFATLFTLSSSLCYSASNQNDFVDFISTYKGGDLAGLVKLSQGDTFNPYLKNSEGVTLVELAEKKDAELSFVVSELAKGAPDAHLGNDGTIDWSTMRYIDFLSYVNAGYFSNFNKFDSNGLTPVHYASRLVGADAYYILKYMQAHGADLDISSSKASGGSTPIQFACEVDAHDGILFLLSLGADPYKEDLYGRDLLKVSKEHGSEICKLIMFKALGELGYKNG